MTISLKIENADSLPDGGPLSYQAHNRGFEIGREHRDWTLPDPNMFISGRHCEVKYENGGYWLYDFSRNGTFLNGARERMRSPHLLADGDRLQIGHYVISIAISSAEPAVAESDPFASSPASSENIWETGLPAPPPIDRRELMPPQKRGRRNADFSEQFLDLPSVQPDPSFGQSFARQGRSGNVEPLPASESPFGPSSAPPPFPETAQTGARHVPASESFASQPFGGQRHASFQPPKEAPRPTPSGHAYPPPQAAGGAPDALLRAIASGAGVSPEIFTQRDPTDVAAEIGAVLRMVVEELALLLKARAAAKVLTKSSNRTMIGAVDNNPLKFVPRPEEILEIMFTRRRAGYLDATKSIEEAFRDLKAHEFATYAAMQKALARLLEDISPEAIESKVPSSAFASRKSRAWETFVATWEAKEKPHENGMLDVFLSYFSDAYSKVSKPK